MGFELAALNLVDFATIIVLVISGVLATLRGLTREIMGLAGWPVSIVAAKLSAPYLEPVLTDLIRVEGISQALAWGIPFIVVVVTGGSDSCSGRSGALSSCWWSTQAPSSRPRVRTSSPRW